MNLPPEIIRLLTRLEESGFEVYLVGGCVRDALLGRKPQDFDLCTNALPREIMQVFSDSRTIPTGLAYGTVTVVVSGRAVEITTYRIDGVYKNSRKPQSVAFAPTIEADLSRRDFTVNALAFHPQKGLIDRFGGVADLASKQLRCVGEPTLRFSEDALRILRGLRFAAQLDFTPEPATYAAMKHEAHRLADVSAERIQAELSKLLLCPRPSKGLLLLRDCCFSVLFPDLQKPEEEQLRSLDALEASLPLRLAALFANTKEEAEPQLRRLRYDCKTLRQVAVLLENLSFPLEATACQVRRLMAKAGKSAPWILALREALLSRDPQEREQWQRFARLYRTVQAQSPCISMASLALNGNDLLAAGVPPGPSVGRELNRLLECVLETPEKNTKERLLAALHRKDAD